MKTHRLIADDGKLYFPAGEGQMEHSLLMCMYDAGDCDTCDWPMIEKPWCSLDEHKRILAIALYTERECNEAFGAHDTIELPDGTLFDFEPLVP